MKNISNSLFLALFLAFITQGIKAQFDDVYYDPNRDRIKDQSKEYNLEQRDPPSDIHEDNYSSESDYDEDVQDWEDQDYYYTSKIKRFHRPYRGFDYYDPCYVDYYFYDPFDFDPWYVDRDLYSSGWAYPNFNRWGRRHHSYWTFNPFWSNWDWYFGWSSFPYSYTYYWPNSCYSRYYNHGYWGGNYYNKHHDWSNNNHWSNNNNNHYDRHPNGTYFGSRRFGMTNSSKRGPVRIITNPPKVYPELPGNSAKPNKDRGTKRIIRSSDGDNYQPREPRVNPEKSGPRLDKNLPNSSGNDSPRKERFEPKKYSDGVIIDQSRESKNEKINKEERFRPHRSQMESNKPERRPQIESPRENRQDRKESYQGSRTEQSRSNNNSRSESSNKSSSGERKSPR